MTKDCIDIQEFSTSGCGRLGVLTLNSPQTLNALSTDMARILLCQLKEWQDDPHIAVVLIRGAGDRAFCSGGDIRSMYESIQQTGRGCRNLAVEDFFLQEYRLDFLIHTYSKPIIVWGQGVVMGGGLGLMIGASHRIVTQDTRMAMPEITIGLFPDVGGSWFLNRLPPGLGCFLGMTGIRWQAADALWMGLADYLLDSSQWAELTAALCASEFSLDNIYNQRMLGLILGTLEHNRQTSLMPSAIEMHRGLWQRAGQGVTAVDVISQILALADIPDPWLAPGVKNLRLGSPITAMLIFEQLRRARFLSLADCFSMEWLMAVHCCQWGDLAEGVRALLIDKTSSPKWQHPSYMQVDVSPYFSWTEAWGEQPILFAP